ncbi:Rieske 2Fe-2S domain-containing protein [Ramlibacter sp. AW1]|uniref:Rieske 2Fe-2S domain-containing protein n=1 Tax=Ramlibacter aurantiacus TaxID=2801330 RepID=A0A936ZVI2_9BURK|nr:Rieske 2Fe-2S domain-containing protein [Ramlibacter aurantiacus]MBL0421905.1 Rieske 2Fe-2S domain-containing protein [Ramlibacter aurantiacus]
MRTFEDLRWPAADMTRIPFAAYRERAIYEQEQERIFRGRTWNYLALEAEVPDPGSYVTSYLGDTPVVVSRDADGQLHAFVNRCAHRGAIVRREAQGQANEHVCCYHQWTYNLQGDLIAVPFRRGVKGKGGLPPDFDTARHSLRKLRVQSYSGAIFGTLSPDVEPLEDYLDEPMCAQLERLLHKPVRVLGYQRQVVHGNWKLYADNLRDPNHGGLLHMFQITFGIARLSNWGGARMDRRHRHNISFTAESTATLGKDDYQQTSRGDGQIKLENAAMLHYRPEFPDPMSLSIMSIFPNVVFHQIGNSLATRQIRTRSESEFEIYWTYYGYPDDDESMTEHRLQQANLAGPGGYISMEDGEAIELVHKALVREQDAYSFVEIGGRGEPADQDTLVTEVPMRGFWMAWRELMSTPSTPQERP